jgi:DNA-binding NtrC family response regulator
MRIDVRKRRGSLEKMSGVETLKVIREGNRDVPVYIVTAFYGDYFKELREMADQGIDFEVIQKPLEMDQIVMIVNGILDGPVLDDSTEEA